MQTEQSKPKFEKFISIDEVSELTGFGTTKIKAWVKKKSFPAPYRTPNDDFLGWTESQIVAWQQSLIAMAA